LKVDRLLDPVDRISEILFGLIMAVTIVGSLSVASAGSNEVRTVAFAALGCNLAWGLVDAVMYLVRTVTERTRNRTLARLILDADAPRAHELIAEAMPPHIAALSGPEELEGMRRRLVESRGERRAILGSRDFLEAIAVFALVVVATFPVVAPFFLVDEVALAMHVSQGLALAMLFAAGAALGKYGGHDRPLVAGIAMGVLGAVLVVAVKALGG